MTKLILIRGNAGSGKTSLATSLQERLGPTPASRQKPSSTSLLTWGQWWTTSRRMSTPSLSVSRTGQALTTDYRVSLRVRELDEHGVTAFITNPDYRVGFTVEQYESELRKAVEAGQLDARMASYLLGRDDSGLAFNSMTYDQLVAFDRGVSFFPSSIRDVDSFKLYISSKDDTYNDLVEQLGEGHD